MAGLLGDGSAEFFAEMHNRSAAPPSAPAELAVVFDAFEREIAAKAKAADDAEVAKLVRENLMEQLEEAGLGAWVIKECERAKLSPSTARQYKFELARYAKSCAAVGAPLWAPETVALYLQELADQGLGMPALRRALTAISRAHETMNPSPARSILVRAVLRQASEHQPATNGAATEH